MVLNQEPGERSDASCQKKLVHITVEHEFIQRFAWRRNFSFAQRVRQRLSRRGMTKGNHCLGCEVLGQLEHVASLRPEGLGSRQGTHMRLMRVEHLPLPRVRRAWA